MAPAIWRQSGCSWATRRSSQRRDIYALLIKGPTRSQFLEPSISDAVGLLSPLLSHYPPAPFTHSARKHCLQLGVRPVQKTKEADPEGRDPISSAMPHVGR